LTTPADGTTVPFVSLVPPVPGLMLNCCEPGDAR